MTSTPTFSTAVSVSQPITVAFGGNNSHLGNTANGQKILLLSNGTQANGQFLLKAPTNFNIRPMVGNNK